MRNYTTKTVALKATTIDTRLLNAKRIDTQKLFVNGVSIDELQGKGGGINNAVKISTTVGSILDNEITTGGYTVRIIRGDYGAILQIEDGFGGYSMTPVATCIHADQVVLSWTTFHSGWECFLWQSDEDYTQLYGGLNENSVIDIYILIHEQQDGDEPVQTSLTGAVQHNVVYHLGEETSLNLSLPSSLVANYASEVVFTSGATPTTVTSDSRIKWVGDDVNAGVFTPVDNVRYSCSLQYDGVFVRGMTFGIPTV